MAKVVFVLGAGASQSVGAPLMYNFLDRAERLLQNGECGDHADAFELIFSGLHQLQATSAKFHIDQTNLESVFAAFEMAKLLGRVGTLSAAQVAMLPEAMRRVIEVTLQQSIVRQVKAGPTISLGAYESFGDTIARLRKKGTTVAVVTFNYDVCCDFIIEKCGVGIDYGLTGQATDSVRLLKLHGSLSWIKCPARAVTSLLGQSTPRLRMLLIRLRLGMPRSKPYLRDHVRSTIKMRHWLSSLRHGAKASTMLNWRTCGAQRPMNWRTRSTS